MLLHHNKQDDQGDHIHHGCGHDEFHPREVGWSRLDAQFRELRVTRQEIRRFIHQPGIGAAGKVLQEGQRSFPAWAGRIDRGGAAAHAITWGPIGKLRE